MNHIRIVSTPSGEAPEEVRREWIGVVLPLLGGPEPVLVTTITPGVLSGPRSYLGQLWGVLRGRFPKTRGFVVNGDDAIAALRQRSPSAADWWIERVHPNLRARLIFDPKACEVVSEPTRSDA